LGNKGIGPKPILAMFLQLYAMMLRIYLDIFAQSLNEEH
jgi:hypothetical protein